MNKKLYGVMDWARIEEIVYGECDHPGDFLGAHSVGRQKLIQAFFPGAEQVSLCILGEESARGKKVREEINMERADDAGFFAALLPGTEKRDYSYHVVYPADPEEKGKKKKTRDVRDPYNYSRILTEKEEERFFSGGERKAYQYMGCHRRVVGGVRGCVFRILAPNASRVSVVGDFNDWNGLANPMNRLSENGIHELFIPGLEEGEVYQYELLLKGGSRIQKADPYSVEQDERGSVIRNLAGYKWGDEKWLEQKKKKDQEKQPLNICEFSLGNFAPAEGKDGCDIRGIADELAQKCKNSGYTHVLLMPVMESVESDYGMQTVLYYAANRRYGTPLDYMYFINAMHKAGLGVILGWNASVFSNAAQGLACYDGSCLYEYEDMRRGIDPRNGLPVFNTGRAEVKEYLLSSLMFWTEFYHADGFCLDDTAAMLYLDYYRKPGEWQPNIYGGVENLENIAFLQEMNAMLHKEKNALISVAAGAGTWSHVTGTEENGLGFDYTTDAGMIRELADYLSKDPIERKNFHHELIGSAQYQYCEHYILPASKELLGFISTDLLGRMAGSAEEKRKNLRLFYGWQMMHVGRKMRTMAAEADAAFYDKLNAFYLAHPALYSCEDSEQGFGWINESAVEANVVSFMRRAGARGEALLVVFNFANVVYERYSVGAEKDGKYRRIFSSADEPSVTTAARDEAADGREQSIRIKLSPLSFSVYEYVPYTAEEKEAIRSHREEVKAKKKEEERKRKAISKARAEIRQVMREETARQIAEAEAVIRSGGEYVVKKN